MPDAIITAGDFSSTARYYFAEFTGPDAIAKIRALPDEIPKRFENNFLEFKSGILGDDENIKGHWAKALGSFANSGGGVLIWGVRADGDDASKIDAVHSVEPVADAQALASKLRNWQPPATDPPVKGVELKVLLLSAASSDGFVVCYIPESDSKPHRSEFGKNKADQKRYNIRISDGTRDIHPPLLRQLFYPKYTARVEVGLDRLENSKAKNVAFRTSGTIANPQIVRLSLFNAGSTSVHEICYRISCGTTFIYRDISSPYFELGAENLSEYSLHPGQQRSEDLLLIPGGDEASIWLIMIFARDLAGRSVTFKHSDLLRTPWKKHSKMCE